MLLAVARRQVTPEELEHLYLSIGKGVWHLQYVEDALQTLITIKHEVRVPGRVNEKEVSDLMAKHRRNTFGTSLKIVGNHSLVPQPLFDRLNAFKEERDWLIHRSQNSHGDRLYTDSGRAETFARLAAFIDEARILQATLLHDINTFLAAAGLDVAAAERMAIKNVGSMRGGT
jgi:hypothetical protein